MKRGAELIHPADNNKKSKHDEANDTKTDDTPKYCKTCGHWVNGPEQWAFHLQRAKHLKNWIKKRMLQPQMNERGAVSAALIQASVFQGCFSGIDGLRFYNFQF